MWSSFMDLDEGMARSCGAEARLEKPFDVETLRKLVLELVPKTRSQRLAHFLEFSPRLNDELVEDPTGKAPTKAAPPTTSPATATSTATAQPTSPRPPPTSDLGARLAARAAAGAQPADRKGPPPPEAFIAAHTAVNLAPLPPEETAAKSSWTMESFDDPSQFEDRLDDKEEFQSLELSNLAPDEVPPENEVSLSIENDTEDEAWARQDLSEFKLDLPPISVGEAGEEFNLDMGEEQFAAPPTPKHAPSAKPKAPPPAAMRIKNDPAPQFWR